MMRIMFSLSLAFAGSSRRSAVATMLMMFWPSLETLQAGEALQASSGEVPGPRC